MTYLEAVNAVLTRLRENTVTTVSASNYSRLIGTLINESKTEVEDSWNWTVLRTTVPVSATSSTDTYELSGTNQRIRMLDAYNATSKTWLTPVGSNYLLYLKNSGTTTGQPSMYANSGVTAATGVRKVTVYPFPNGNYTLNFNCVIPQTDLSSDSTVISVPVDPVVQGAYLRAIIERGEDQGRLSEIQEIIYRKSLADAIVFDQILHDDETVWRAI